MTSVLTARGPHSAPLPGIAEAEVDQAVAVLFEELERVDADPRPRPGGDVAVVPDAVAVDESAACATEGELALNRRRGHRKGDTDQTAGQFGSPPCVKAPAVDWGTRPRGSRVPPGGPEGGSSRRRRRICTPWPTIGPLEEGVPAWAYASLRPMRPRAQTVPRSGPF